MFFCVTICMVAISGAIVLKSTYEKRWSDPLLLENAEALAQDNGGWPTNPGEGEGGTDCYRDITASNDKDNEDIFCGTCDHVPNSQALKDSRLGVCGK